MFRPHIFVSAPNLLVFHLKFDFEADLAWFLDQIFSSFFSFFCWCFRGQNDPLQNAGVLSRVSFMCVRVHSFAFILPPFYLILPIFCLYFTSLNPSKPSLILRIEGTKVLDDGSLPPGRSQVLVAGRTPDPAKNSAAGRRPSERVITESIYMAGF